MESNICSFQELTDAQQASAGGKGSTLSRLYQAGFPVPDGFIIFPTAFSEGELEPDAWTQVLAQLNELRRKGDSANGLHPVTLAVRSSAMAEDSVQASFAGEFETVLNVRTNQEIWQAIHAVYRSRRAERVQAYAQAKGIRPTRADGLHEIAVIVQRLVPAAVSGVMFTAHPITGARDRVLVNASWGLGEAIVSGRVTPDTLIIDKATGRIDARQTADKHLMTACSETGVEELPVPKTDRRAPVLSDEQAAELAELGVRIESLYGTPLDIEWTLAEGAFSIVQARPITALPAEVKAREVGFPHSTEWTLPAGSYTAMRNNIVEMMVEPLTPLFRTLGLASVNASLGRLLASFFGRPGLMPDEIIITINQYAYYNGSWSAGQLARILLRSVGIMRHMFTGAVERWTEEGRPQYGTAVERWQEEPWPDRTATEILEAVRELAEAAIDAYGSLVSGVIPAAWITEGLFSLAYRTAIKRRNDPAAPVYLLGFDSTPIRAEKSLYDLAQWARARQGLAHYLDASPAGDLATQLDENTPPPGVEPSEWQAWLNLFRSHLEAYGHTVYSLDFGNPVPADDPVPLLETFKWFLSGQGANPHERQKAAVDRREQATQAIQGRLGGLRLRLFHKLLEPAQRYAPLREDGLADIGLAYPLLRQMLRELGSRFVSAGMIQEPSEIFWLEQQEVEQAAAGLDRGDTLTCLTTTVAQRQEAYQSAKRLTPPLGLIRIRLLGRQIEKATGARSRRQDGDTLKGVAASPGSVTARARVLHGPEDFHRMSPGEVLVAPLTTPAWTPLFARAAAIVTDIGGPLSHGSIVAREYGIPAVLGTESATRRIHDGQLVTVDGDAGLVTLDREEGRIEPG